MSIINDEPVYEDALGHYELVRRVGHRILKCNPPYVIGVCGSWGAGKTSFLRMLWTYLGGPFELPNRESANLTDDERKERFEESRADFDELVGKRNLELIWFNPWQHQFESSPLVALLHEIRRHFSFKPGLFDKAGKIIDVASYATLNALAEVGKSIKIPLPSAKSIMEGEREYDAEHFSAALTSQRFRDFFEGAIRTVTEEKKGKKGLLVIFIDDLDRCEGDVAYRLLEALKLYLNADNCVYVLGLDQQHLENSIAKALSGEKETWRYRPMARDYLSKIFQTLFHLPVPRRTSEYVEKVLDSQDEDFKRRLDELFALTANDWPKLVRALDENLPHNPRKIKSFITSWKLYLDSLPKIENENDRLDWRLTLILHYLAQFEEPLFRKVEEAPAFYSDHILKFCRGEFSVSPHPLFYGLERPYEMSRIDETGNLDDESGGLDDPGSTSGSEQKKDESKPLAEPRIFWISRLVVQLAKETTLMPDDEFIHRHLLQTGDKSPEPIAEE
ncbi:MAG: KAP family NTPase [Blastocatellia bacterium]|nr:KAP family NTPase [Blastocatellia bacterium]